MTMNAVEGVGKSPNWSILIVEDDPSLRDLLQKYLTQQGCQIMALSDAQSALAYLRSLPDLLNLILTDVSLPGMDGYDLLKEVRRLNPRILVIILSGLTEEAVQRSAEAEPDAILKKPISLVELGETVFRVLRRKKE